MNNLLKGKLFNFLLIVPTVFLIAGCTKGTMPSDQNTIKKFQEKVDERVEKDGTDSSDPMALVKSVRSAIQGMGYNYDKTICYWMLNPQLAKDELTKDLYKQRMVVPIFHVDTKDLFAEKLISDETGKILDAARCQEKGVNEEKLEAVLNCKREGNIIKHADMAACLEARGREFDNEIHVSTDMYVYLFDMKVCNLIKTHSRYENNIEYIDIEIVDVDKLKEMHQGEIYLKEMRKKYSQ